MVTDFKRIKMKNPLVEMDGDEMTRIIWELIKNILLIPFIELNTEYYDLGIKKRDETNDAITSEAAFAIKKYGVGVKCATITPNEDRQEEYGLKQIWKSPNGTIRSILDGTVFRTPIIVNNLKPYVPTWKKPITIARHAFGDIYKDVEFRTEGPGRAELIFSEASGEITKRLTINEFRGGGVVMGMFNLDESIRSFAKTCFSYALDSKLDLWFSAKDTISKIYDRTFRNIFQEVYELEFKEKFKAAGIEYFYSLIDDLVHRVIRSEGGMVWACKNYDGDVMSDLVATIFGSLSMMTSVLVSPEGYYEYEAAHGTVQRHYYRYLKGEKTSTNPMATIFAWTGALKKRGALDGNSRLEDFAEKLEKASLQTIEDSVITGDLNELLTTPDRKVVNTEEFLVEIKKRLEESLNA